ncbi:MAG: T9SS type A sorting domain-containing protein [Saprospiraceae bacterium]|nr:T9SS type A sorting domain-containing protein [Saprospiraceae bacterium]
MRHLLISSMILCFLWNLSGQAFLKPFIGLTSRPLFSDSICEIQNYLGNFENSGYRYLDTAHDFQLYDINGGYFRLSEMLDKGKPVLLISSSYTCPVFRGKIPEINELFAQFKDQIEIVVVYTVEAHPDKDISPYFGRVNTGQQNIGAGILYRQPATYGERKRIIEDMLLAHKIDAKILIDGPCNEWWYHYGPAPNNATLVDTDGRIKIKHAWFDRDPDDIFCDVQKFLDPQSVCDSVGTGISTFSFQMKTDSVVKAEVNGVSYVSGTLKNTGNNKVRIEIQRLLNDLPAGWSSSMCLDVCYPADVDSTQISLEPGQEMEFIIDIFTGPDPGTARLRMGMRNVDDPTNRSSFRITVQSEEPTALEEDVVADVKVFLVPAEEILRIRTNQYDAYQLLNDRGQIIRSSWFQEIATIDRKGLSNGMYILKLSNPKGQHYYRKVIFI